MIILTRLSEKDFLTIFEEDLIGDGEDSWKKKKRYAKL